MNTQSWGAIFDWDGVIIDSSKHHETAWERLAQEERRELPPGHFKLGFGRKNQYIIPNILRWTEDLAEVERLGNRKEELYREAMAESGLTPLPGVKEWLEKLRDAGVPCAVGSSTPRKNIELALSLIHLAPFFKAIITAEDVSVGKPNPEVFLKAAERIGCPPSRCVVFEDAHVGLEAAHAGGMKAVGIATTHPVSELINADLAVCGMDELSVEKLAQWFTE